VAEGPTRSMSSGEHFHASMTELAGQAGARAMGANITRVPPGKAAFPIHHHYANEEHFFVLSGKGVLRVGNETWDVRKDDYIVNLPGGPEHAHQIINTGTEELVYLALSTMVVPEIVGYPDSAKSGMRIAPGADPGARALIRDSDRNAIGYWDGEDGQRVAAIVARSRQGA
jgi:uncharacterized cupin superfamily protein